MAAQSERRLSDALDRIVERFRQSLNSLRRVAQAVIPRKFHPHAFRLYLGMLRPLYAGDAVFCPCCGRSFRDFAPYRINGINYVCPACGSFQRHRLLWLFLKEKTDLFTRRLRVLHVAPEDCFQSVFRSLPNLDYLSADLNSSLAMEKMDIENIRYPNNSFDVILCNHVLEHVTDDRRAMREMARVLKPNGWAILQCPLDSRRMTTLEDPNIITPKDRKRFYWQEDHWRLYGRDYKHRLEQAGFAVNVYAFAQNLGEEAIRRFGLLAHEEIYLCSKPHNS
jgi:SAM-dependent methyltransferase